MLVAVYQRPVVDFSLDPDHPMLHVQPRPVRHLLDDPDATVAIDGSYLKTPIDILDWPPGSYLDPGSDACQDCIRAAAQTSEQQR